MLVVITYHTIDKECLFVQFALLKVWWWPVGMFVDQGGGGGGGGEDRH